MHYVYSKPPPLFAVDLPPAGHRIYMDFPDPDVAVPRFNHELKRNDVTIEEVIGTGS